MDKIDLDNVSARKSLSLSDYRAMLLFKLCGGATVYNALDCSQARFATKRAVECSVYQLLKRGLLCKAGKEDTETAGPSRVIFKLTSNGEKVLEAFENLQRVMKEVEDRNG
jgi:hypothetical protein